MKSPHKLIILGFIFASVALHADPSSSKVYHSRSYEEFSRLVAARGGMGSQATHGEKKYWFSDARISCISEDKLLAAFIFVQNKKLQMMVEQIDQDDILQPVTASKLQLSYGTNYRFDSKYPHWPEWRSWRVEIDVPSDFFEQPFKSAIDATIISSVIRMKAKSLNCSFK